MTMIDALKKSTVFCPVDGFVNNHHQIDFTKFSACEIPAVMVTHPAMLTVFIICADGSLCLVENGYFEDDFDDLKLGTASPLLHAAAMPKVFDLIAGLRGGTEFHAARSLSQGIPGHWCFSGITAAARELIGVSSDMSLKQISEFCSNSGGSPEQIQEPIDRHSEALKEPLFIPEDTKSWQDADEKEVADLIVDIMNSDSEFEGGTVTLRVHENSDGDHLTIDHEEDPHHTVRVLALLDVLCNFSARFSGTSWEYNDGAINRESGYYSDAAVVYEADMESPSNHERLAARRRLTERLQTKGLGADAINTLLKCAQEA